MPENQSDYTFNVFKRAELDRIIASASTSAPWLVPVFRAVRDGRINLVMPQRDAVLTTAFLEQSSRPLIISIGDDDGAETGPAGWACIPMLQKWGRGAMINGAAGEARDYELAVIAAMTVGRFVIVECGTAHQQAWEAAISPNMSALAIRARPDSPHPAPRAKGDLN